MQPPNNAQFTENNWHAKDIDETLATLKTTEHGLTEAEAKSRLARFGPNRLPEPKRESLFSLFFRQFQSPLIYILLGAGILVLLIGETTDALVIFFVLLFNAVVGTVQEGKAQQTLAALKSFTETEAEVLREGKEVIIPSWQVVPGDILILQEGEKVPADARIILSSNLKLDEASLTGESEPVHKTADTLNRRELPLAEHMNMVFAGTHVVFGNGKALVVRTGTETFIGKISQEILSIDTDIPLKRDVRNLSRIIIFTVLSISSVLLAIGTAFGKSLAEMFATVVSLSVSIIPEGLPIVLTLVLATGVWRMSQRHALVKKLQAVEALGQARIIAIDKTGTLTKNELVIQRVMVAGKIFEVTGSGYDPRGEIFLLGEKGERQIANTIENPALLAIGKIAAFSSNARVAFQKDSRTYKIHGDPTEAALIVFAQKLGFEVEKLDTLHPELEEIPFSHQTKYHASVRHIDGGRLAAVSGAPEVILERARRIWQPTAPLPQHLVEGGETQALSNDVKRKLEDIFHDFSREGFRVLACAFAAGVEDSLNDGNLPPLTFVGFLAMRDALRPETKEAVKQARQAGMKIVMITGDHRITAEAVAREAGILDHGDILTGQEIDELTDEKLANKIERVTVFARVTPDHKLRIIRAYRKRGEIVAMTGDGVNDAPSLVAADLGVAMGKIGTDVAKEASDIVLLDDNLSSIVSAIEEGRSIYKTIKKVILYLFSTSIGEVLTISGALLAGLPLPILPAQIIWLNLVTDGFLDVALAMEPKEERLLKETFERPRRFLVDKLMVERMVVMALPMMIGTLLLFAYYDGSNLIKAWTISLTVLAVFQWFNAWNCRHETKSIFQTNPLSNKFLVAATIIIIFLQLAALYTPFMQKILRTTPLSLNDWMIIVPVAASIVVAEEIRKAIARRTNAARNRHEQTQIVLE